MLGDALVTLHTILAIVFLVALGRLLLKGRSHRVRLSLPVRQRIVPDR
ncbi:hypothetical protein [Lutibaculum baratangense]|uniref:Uncharacterized protein n=1 Tax=Lutibaculum baratangense AMV1 TaxID=631454 RepID=V4R4X3_9HYPH|nr:hypothetical protein [Lutibaculum baratangense]ESR26997.1 hypothetical protein N177_0423 [Lutibaculum baratangense AMV1]